MNELTISKNSLKVPLDSYFNNQGFSSYPGEASFDQLNNSFPASGLPRGGTYNSTQTGTSYIFPGYVGSNKSDNVVCVGQTVSLAAAKYFSVQMLVAADLASTAGNLTLTYTDNTTSLSEVRSEPFYSFLTIFKGEIIMPSYYTNNATNFNTSNIFEFTGYVDSSKTLSSITFPDTSNTTTGSRLHVFSLSLWKGTGVQVQYVRPTQKMSDVREGVQIVELVVDNAGPDWISGGGVEVSIEAPGVMTVEPAKIKRLRPGDQKKINVGVIGSGNVTAKVVMTGSVNATSTFEHVEIGLKSYTSDLANLNRHESPEWFNDAKFGIFIRKVPRIPCAVTILIGIQTGGHTPCQVGEIPRPTRCMPNGTGGIRTTVPPIPKQMCTTTT